MVGLNANPVRTILRSFASAACLVAVLVLGIPCLMAQGPPAPAAVHCSDCCGTAAPLTTPQFCCAPHRQPAQPSDVAASPILRTVQTLPAPSPLLPRHHRTILISASISPPPLHPILRI